MNISNKRELHQIPFNYLSNIGFRDIIDLYKKCTAKSYFLLLIETILAPDNSISCWKNILERVEKLIMTIVDKIRDEKLQFNINRVQY